MQLNKSSLLLNGTSQYGSKTNCTGLGGQAAFTVEALFRVSSIGGSERNIAGFGTRAAPSTVGAHLRLTIDGHLSAYIGSGGTDNFSLSSSTLSTGIWYHAAAVYDGTDIRVFLGTMTTPTALDTASITAKTGTINTPGAGHAGLYIGTIGVTSQTDYSDFFPGYLNMVRFWSRALTSQELTYRRNRKMTGNESGLVASFNFQETTGTSLDDLSSNNNNVTLVNTPTWSAVQLPFAKFKRPQGLVLLDTLR